MAEHSPAVGSGQIRSDQALTPAERTLLNGVDTTAVIGAVQHLVAIPSIGGSEAEIDIQRHIAQAWADDGLNVTTWDIDINEVSAREDFPGMEVDRTGGLGVIARWPGGGTGPVLMLLGHTDVVPPGDTHAWSSPAFTPVLKDGRIHGRGTADMKAGLVAAWMAVRSLRAQGITLQGEVILAAVSGEEDGGLGTYSLLAQGITADACIIPEPTDLDVVPANGGALTFRLIVHGAATHASRRTEGVSAIEKFALALTALGEFEAQRNATVDPLMQRWSLAYPLSIGTVHAGDWASTVPDLCIAEGRLGVALDETSEQARTALERAVQELCDGDPWLRDHPIEVQWWGGQFAPGRTDPEHPLVALMLTSHARRTGETAQVYGGPYGSDLRLLVGAGIPTLQYGPGDSRVAHAPDEWVLTDDVVTCTEVLMLAIMEFCGVAVDDAEQVQS
jgi:acetylornithine deacetylase